PRLRSWCRIACKPRVIPGRDVVASPEIHNHRPFYWARLSTAESIRTAGGFAACAAPRNDELTRRVTGQGADHAFLAAELVAFAGGFVERGRNMRPHRVAVRTARVGHVDRQRGAGALHGDGRAVALALLQGGCARRALARIVISLAIGTALADRKRAGGPGL